MVGVKATEQEIVAALRYTADVNLYYQIDDKNL